MPNTQTYKITGVPADKLAQKVAQYKADPNYVTHTATPEDAAKTTYTIEVTFNVPDP